jgi:hypothetical protein
MAYTPLDSNIYLAAITGALSGMGLTDRIPTSTDPLLHQQQGEIARAYGEALDQYAGVQFPPYAAFLPALVTAYSAAAWQDRCPPYSPESLDPATYGPLVQSVVSVIIGGFTAIFNEGPLPSLTNVGEAGVSPSDQIPDFLNAKLVAGAGVTLTVLNPGMNEQLQIDAGAGPTGPNVTRVTIFSGAIFTDTGAALYVPGPSHTSLTGNVIVWASLECGWGAPVPNTEGTIQFNFGAPIAPTGGPPNVIYRVDAGGVNFPGLPFIMACGFADGVGLGPVAYSLNVSGGPVGPPDGNLWTVNGVTWIIMDVAP